MGKGQVSDRQGTVKGLNRMGWVGELDKNIYREITKLAYIKTQIIQFSLTSIDINYYSGKIYAIQNNVQFHGDTVDGMLICLDPTASFFVRIHDSKYFFLAPRPEIFPEILKQYEAKARLNKKFLGSI